LTVKSKEDYAILETIDLVKSEMPLLDNEISVTRENNCLGEATVNSTKEINPKQARHYSKSDDLPLQMHEQLSAETDKLPVHEHHLNKSHLPQTDYNVKHEKIGKTHLKERNNLRRTASEESFMWKSLCDVKPQRHVKPHHFSKSLCNVELEVTHDEREVSPERRSSTGTIKGTSRIHTRSAINRNTGTKINNTDSLISSTSHEIHNVNNTDQKIMVFNASQSKPRASTIGTWNPPMPDKSFSVSAGGPMGQLNREKKAPKHLRRVPSGSKMVSAYYMVFFFSCLYLILTSLVIFCFIFRNIIYQTNQFNILVYTCGKQLLTEPNPAQTLTSIIPNLMFILSHLVHLQPLHQVYMYHTLLLQPMVFLQDIQGSENMVHRR
jgi:hypothetical protein